MQKQRRKVQTGAWFPRVHSRLQYEAQDLKGFRVSFVRDSIKLHSLYTVQSTVRHMEANGATRINFGRRGRSKLDIYHRTQLTEAGISFQNCGNHLIQKNPSSNTDIPSLEALRHPVRSFFSRKVWVEDAAQCLTLGYCHRVRYRSIRRGRSNREQCTPPSVVLTPATSQRFAK